MNMNKNKIDEKYDEAKITEVEVHELLDAIEEAVGHTHQNVNMKEKSKHLTIEQLKELIKSKGPNGITIAKTVAKRASKTMEGFINDEDTSEATTRNH